MTVAMILIALLLKIAMTASIVSNAVCAIFALGLSVGLGWNAMLWLLRNWRRRP